MRSMALILILTLGIVSRPAMAYEVGDAVADLQLTDLNGEPVSLHDHLGEIIVLNFFTTWCPGCNEEATVLENEIWQVYQDQGVVVIAVDIQEPVGLVQSWALALGVTYAIWWAPGWDVLDAFTSSPALPYNTVIDRDMTLAYGQLGFDRDEILAVLGDLLEATPTESTAWGDVKALFQ